ncbi:glycoside hydrolase family 5 protein [Micromonospora sp. DT81.3]|uniref:glycoside hydrolase family 5 protein n=1 Tax=Micromonospora sp. DT81.3 TaxID=3416523 RepID=UPI003CE761E5
MLWPSSTGDLLLGGSGEQARPTPRPTSTDPSGGRAVGSRSVDETLRFGDGSYLDGHDYLRGVNIYSLIFAGKQDDLSTLGEPASSYAFLASRGVSIIRLAVPWQRLQEIPPGGDAADGLQQPIDAAYLEVVAEQVNRAANAGIRTIIDLHNGCTYPWGAGDFVEGSLRCGDGITEAHVTNLWQTIAERFRDDERVAAYDIFNEPRWSVGVQTYKRYAQVAVDAIRSTGDDHVIWVEGILSDKRGRLAAIARQGPWVIDPLDKVMYSEHFYANERGAGFVPGTDYSPVLDRLRTFGDWCRAWAVRCSVGEVGWPSGGANGAQSDADAAGWNELFDQFYSLADEYELDVTYFAASSTTQVGTLLAYVSSDPRPLSPVGIDTALSQASVIEAHLSRPTHPQDDPPAG